MGRRKQMNKGRRRQEEKEKTKQSSKKKEKVYHRIKIKQISFTNTFPTYFVGEIMSINLRKTHTSTFSDGFYSPTDGSSVNHIEPYNL